MESAKIQIIKLNPKVIIPIKMGIFLNIFKKRLDMVANENSIGPKLFTPYLKSSWLVTVRIIEAATKKYGFILFIANLLD